jgi:hypothetical protein
MSVEDDFELLIDNYDPRKNYGNNIVYIKKPSNIKFKSFKHFISEFFMVSFSLSFNDIKSLFFEKEAAIFHLTSDDLASEIVGREMNLWVGSRNFTLFPLHHPSFLPISILKEVSEMSNNEEISQILSIEVQHVSIEVNNDSINNNISIDFSVVDTTQNVIQYEDNINFDDNSNILCFNISKKVQPLSKEYHDIISISSFNFVFINDFVFSIKKSVLKDPDKLLIYDWNTKSILFNTY